LRRPKYGGIRAIRIPRNRPEAGLPELLIGTSPVSALVEPCRTLGLLGEEETGEGHSGRHSVLMLIQPESIVFEPGIEVQV
jgi:hypothetical protein